MKGRNKNKQGRKAQSPQALVQHANRTAKQDKTQPVQLEVPEGYKPKSKPGTKKRRRNKKGATAHIGTSPISRTQLETMDDMVVTDPPAGKKSAKLSRAQEIHLGVVPRIRGEELPSMAQFFKVEGRKWKSLGTKSDAKQFLQSYEELQQRKYDPEVFAVEKADPEGSMTGAPFKAADLDKLQALRAEYYKDEKRVDKLVALEKNANWPNQFGIMTKAPFVRTSPTEHHYKEHMSNRFLPIFKAMGVHEIAQKIISHMPTFVPMARLSQTCHHAFNIVAVNTERWDMTAADFLGDDQENRLGNYCRLPLIVGPVRSDMLPTEKNRPYNTSYGDGFNATIKLFKALNHRATMIANLQLHRLSYLDVAGVNCILGSLPNLESLGVYQCPLLHFGKTKDLLDAIKSHPKDEDGPRKYVYLDFFPMYHQGPNNMARHGSYGVSWSPLGCDTASAILQIVLYELYPAARELGINLFSWESSFRLFLEKCPMPNWAIVKVYEAIRTFECSRGRNAIADINKYDPNLECWKDFANELAAAVIGDQFDPFIVNTRADKRLEELYQTTLPFIPYRRAEFWWHRQERCTTCDNLILWLFVPFAEGFCWGCILKQYLDAQVDHHKTAMAKTAAVWLGGRQRLSVKERELLEPAQYELPEDNGDQPARLSDAKCLQDALVDRRVNAGLRFANLADSIRSFEMYEKHCLDAFCAADPDALSLERRHAKYYDRHGPIDRKFNDRQYRPVGSFNIAVSTVFLPREYAHVAASLKLGEWWEQFEFDFPELSHDEIAKKVFEYWGRHVVACKDYYERQRQNRIYCDTTTIRARFGQLVKRTGTPNRAQMCWDDMIGQMLVDRYPDYQPAEPEQQGPIGGW